MLSCHWSIVSLHWEKSQCISIYQRRLLQRRRVRSSSEQLKTITCILVFLKSNTELYMLPTRHPVSSIKSFWNYFHTSSLSTSPTLSLSFSTFSFYRSIFLYPYRSEITVSSHRAPYMSVLGHTDPGVCGSSEVTPLSQEEQPDAGPTPVEESADFDCLNPQNYQRFTPLQSSGEQQQSSAGPGWSMQE